MLANWEVTSDPGGQVSKASDVTGCRKKRISHKVLLSKDLNDPVNIFRAIISHRCYHRQDRADFKRPHPQMTLLQK